MNTYCLILGEGLKAGVIVVLKERAHVVFAVCIRTLPGLDDRRKVGQVTVGGLEAGSQKEIGRIVKCSPKSL